MESLDTGHGEAPAVAMETQLFELGASRPPHPVAIMTSLLQWRVIEGFRSPRGSSRGRWECVSWKRLDRRNMLVSIGRGRGRRGERPLFELHAGSGAAPSATRGRCRGWTLAGVGFRVHAPPTRVSSLSRGFCLLGPARRGGRCVEANRVVVSRRDHLTIPTLPATPIPALLAKHSPTRLVATSTTNGSHAARAH